MRAPLLSLLVLAGCSAENSGPARTSASSARPATTLSAASGDPATSPAASASAAPVDAPLDPEIAAQIHAPPGVDAAGRYPFVMFLHGLGGTGRSFATALGVERLAADKKFYWASPDGTIDRKQRRFWNATASCCDFDHLGADHVASLGAIVSQARRTQGIDPSRVFVIGFSNGAFMAHELGCRVPGIAGIVSVAGAAPSPSDGACTPAAPVAVLEIHGDADKAVRFEGGHVLDMHDVPAHRSAEDSVAMWAAADGCKGSIEEKGQLDLMAGLPGAETRDLRYAGCRAPVALWRVVGGDHFIATSRPALEQMWTFLSSALPSAPP